MKYISVIIKFKYTFNDLFVLMKYCMKCILCYSNLNIFIRIYFF